MSLLHLPFSSTPTCPLSLTTKLSNLSFKMSPIRMGGGPRTFPGGVSKWQWKRMQRNKSKQLLKARLARERQIYEMRKRAELKAAVSELERPWEKVEKPPNLFSVSADDQLKVLADRFQKPGGLDLWSERDGPELFRLDNGLPSARFFPKGVVHSVKAYGKVKELGAGCEENLVGDGEEDTSGELVRIGGRNLGNVSGERARSSGGNVNGGAGNRRTYSNNLEKINRLMTRGSREGDDAGEELDRNEYYGKSGTRGSSSLELGGGNVSKGRSRNFRGNVSEGKRRTQLSDSGKINHLIGRGGYGGEDAGEEFVESDKEMVRERNGYVGKSGSRRSSMSDSDVRSRSSDANAGEGRRSSKGYRRSYSSDSEKMSRGNGSFGNPRRENSAGEFRRSRDYQKGEKRSSEVFDMSLQHDGSYGVN